MSADNAIRVRIAPSPTGNLHIGTARTSLFNYLFARHTGGKFILRIEDTDLERSEEKYTQDIYEGLKLLGLHWDEGPDMGGPYGPYKQSERLELYREYAQKLLESGHAYHCYCSQAELEAEKQQAMEEKRLYVYSRRCCDAAVAAELAKDPNRKPVIRFKVPQENKEIVFQDLIRGEVRFESAQIGDFVLVKSNGIASYNFAVVVDDVTMKISHVIRGEDHVSNTPKQIVIYQALGAPLPQFAHVSMILAPDRSKMSKRHGATAVSEFIRQGYLPEAFVNFITLLGWSPTDGEEIGTLEHFASQFTLERIVSSPAVFDQEKLNWLNGVKIRSLELDDLLNRARPFLADFDLSRYSDDQLRMMLGAVREPIALLGDLPQAVSYFFDDSVPPEGDVMDTVLKTEDTQAVLKAFLDQQLPQMSFESPESLSADIKAFAETLKPMKMKTIMWAIRAALTGRVHGADMGKTLFILGKQQVQKRVEQALETAHC